MDWVQVFKTGRHADSSGETKEWTREDLDRIVSQYDPSKHEAPICVGHPVDNSPAFGWVESLKRDGEYLLAKFKNLLPEFIDLVKRGLFKKRSISLYPDFSLRHVGFLGAAVPAVKGLEEIKFQGKEGTTISFSDFQDNINFEEGGTEMSNLKKDDMEKEIQRRVGAVRRNPPAFDDQGNKFSETPTYAEALNYVFKEDPELAQKYAEAYRRKPSGRFQNFNEAAGERIMEFVQEKMRNDKTLCYNEALAKVQLENPDLIREYLGLS